MIARCDRLWNRGAGGHRADRADVAGTRGLRTTLFTCVHSNGGGVYTQELGNAGIGPTNFMITHFFN